MHAKRIRSSYGIDNNGINNVLKEHWNHNTPMLYEDIISRREGHMVHLGPIVVRTGLHTGRAAKDKFIVKEPETQDKVWWGKVNVPVTQKVFENMFRRLQAYLQDREVWIQDCFAGYDERYRLPVRVVTIDAGTHSSRATFSSRRNPRNSLITYLSSPFFTLRLSRLYRRLMEHIRKRLFC